MIIRKVAVGNTKEAYIEDRFSESINLVISNDNNRGKTILFQTMMYALGNMPNFPNGFMIDEYYYYCEFENNNDSYKIVRRKNTFSVLKDESLSIFQNEEEFRNWFDNEIFSLPRFRTDIGLTKADLPLFLQLFFLPQDNRNTSTIFNPGHRTKKDFISMIESMFVSNDNSIDYQQVKVLKERKQKLDKEVSVLIKKNTFLKTNNNIASEIFSGIDKIETEKIKEQFDEINTKLSELRNKRRREINRKSKLQTLLTELNSVNRMIDVGALKCAKCGSDEIIFDLDKTTFDISNKFVRNQIIISINDRIKEKEQIIDDLSSELYQLEEKIKDLIIETPREINDYLLYKSEIEDANHINEDITNLQREIEVIKQQIKEIEQKEETRNSIIKKKYDDLLSNIRKTVRKIDPESSIYVEDLFSKNKENYSGSDTTVFYISKLLNLCIYLNLPFPLIIDSFREGEVSSSREEIILHEFETISNQIIISATLKNEEYNVSKYDKFKTIKILDFSNVENCKLLTSDFVPSFIKIISEFGIKIE